MLEDTKGVIRNRYSKYRQHKGHQSTTHTTKEWTARTSHKKGVNIQDNECPNL